MKKLLLFTFFIILIQFSVAAQQQPQLEPLTATSSHWNGSKAFEDNKEGDYFEEVYALIIYPPRNITSYSPDATVPPTTVRISYRVATIVIEADANGRPVKKFGYRIETVMHSIANELPPMYAWQFQPSKANPIIINANGEEQYAHPIPVSLKKYRSNGVTFNYL